MARRTAPTVEDLPIPVVLVVQGTADILRAAGHAAGANVARAESCTVGEVATQAAKWRPFAIVFPDNIYGLDPEEFSALARDVGAKIIRIHKESEQAGLMGYLMTEIGRALKGRAPP